MSTFYSHIQHTIIVTNVNKVGVLRDLDRRITTVQSGREIPAINIKHIVVHDVDLCTWIAMRWWCNGDDSRCIHIMDTSCVNR